MDSLKKELESLKSLKKEEELLKSNYPKGVEFLTSDLDNECKKVVGLQVEMDHLKKTRVLIMIPFTQYCNEITSTDVILEPN